MPSNRGYGSAREEETSQAQFVKRIYIRVFFLSFCSLRERSLK